MKNIAKVAVVGAAGLAGYFVGFYEIKYKTMKALTETMMKQVKEIKNSKEEDAKEEL